VRKSGEKSPTANGIELEGKLQEPRWRPTREKGNFSISERDRMAIKWFLNEKEPGELLSSTRAKDGERLEE